jgi:site-specific DNA recombinase
MKAILLARVSSKEQEENNSIPAQLRRLQDYAERRGFSEIESHKLVESSTKKTRKEFSSILTSVRRSKIKVALVADTIDRVQRSFKESVQLDEIVKDGKLEIHFIREGLIISDTSNSADILRWDMGVMFAKSYVTQLSDNVKRGTEQKWLNGEWSGQAPVGYRNFDSLEGRKDIEPDEATKHVVRDMYNWYASGAYSFLQIQSRLRTEHAVEMATSQIDRVLKNPFYYGVMRVKDKLYPHKYEPIISKQLFDQVQAIKDRANKKPRKYGGLPYFYRGLISCSKCGMRITVEKQKGTVYYHCTQSRGKHSAKYVTEDELTSQLRQAFSAIQPNDEQFNLVMHTLKISNQDKTRYRKSQQGLLNAELSKVSTRQERLFDIYIDGVIDKQSYENKLNDLRSAQVDIEQRIANLGTASNEFYDNIQRIMEIARDAPLTLLSSKIDRRRELLTLVLSNLTLHENQLRWEYKKPFDIMYQTAQSQTWLGWRDSNPRMHGPKPCALPLGHTPTVRIELLLKTLPI